MLGTQQNLGDLFFALCVNFLLYCALIIVFYMLITFYLEEETSTKGYTKVATYEDVEEEDEEDDEDEDEDDEDDNNEEEEKKISDKESEKGVELVDRKRLDKPVSPLLLSPLTPSHDSPYTIVSGRKTLLPASSSSSSSSSTNADSNPIVGAAPLDNNSEILHEPLTSSSAPDSVTGTTSTTSSTRTSQSSSSQATLQMMIKKVVFYGVGLTTTFSIWGIVQERMLTQPYDGVYFKYSYCLIFLNRLGGLLLSLSLMSYLKVSWVHSPLWEYSFPSVANMLSSWCQYEALKYVTFPTQTLSKAFKVVPVM